MKIAVAQMDCQLGNVTDNVAAIQDRIQQAADANCELVVFPEMADTGYEMQTIVNCASELHEGPCHSLQASAKKHGVAVHCGLSERVSDKVYNAAVTINTEGEVIAKYRKTHLFSLAGVREDAFLSGGTDLTQACLGEFTFGIMICYDLRFPELSRSLGLAGANALICIAAWPSPRIDIWSTLTKARAIENQAYMIAANRIGTDGSLTFGGTSQIVDPRGKTIARAASDKEALLIAEIDSNLIKKTRASMPVYDDRRPDLYAL